MPQTPITDAVLDQLVAARALGQLNRRSVYPKVAVVSYESGAFERSQKVTVRRPKRRLAQDLDPRASAATYNEGEFFSAEVTLNRLWTDGFPVYGNDPSVALKRYIDETATQMADSIMTPNDDYMYSAFRSWVLPATGNVGIGAHAPLSIVASVDSNGQIAPITNTQVRQTETIFDRNNVPSSDRFMVLSATAKGDLIGDAIVVSTGNIPSGLSIQQGEFVSRGLPLGEFTSKYNFMVTGSNAVQGQAGRPAIHGALGTVAIASVAVNNAFSYADFSSFNPQLVGALDFTLTAPDSIANLAVGQIARIGTASKATAFGVILRIDTTTAIAPIITLAPYSPAGILLVAGQITPGTDVLSIPAIGSVNTANHREAILMANRSLREPTQGSGARATSLNDPETGLVIQIFIGQYEIARVRETNAYFMLTGTQISDSRKTALVLSA